MSSAAPAAAPTPAAAAAPAGTPYIMPDGPGGRRYTLSGADRAAGSRGSGARGRPARGKDAAWADLQSSARGAAGDDAAAAELRAIARAGWRRRNRWFNDRALREMHQKRFGPMTAADMLGEFNPVPFGGPVRRTAFAEVAGGAEGAALWSHFVVSEERAQKRR